MSFDDGNFLSFIEHDEPEMVISEQVQLKGEIAFDRYIVVHGSFEGSIVSNKGNIYVGQSGTVISDMNNMNIVVVEGNVIGNIRADRLVMRGNANLQGDVHCSSVVMGPNTTMIGQMHSLFDPSAVDNETDINIQTQKNTVLFIVDPQTDFHAGGSCAIEGADENSQKIADFIQNNKERIDEIIVSLDSHHRMHISHGAFWCNAWNESPTPFTIISSTDVDSGLCISNETILA